MDACFIRIALAHSLYGRNSIARMVFHYLPPFGLCTSSYVERWRRDQADGVEYLSFLDGLPDVAVCHDADREDRSKWSSDAGWMVGYYSVAVWSSIWLMAKAPMIEEIEERKGGRTSRKGCC